MKLAGFLLLVSTSFVYLSSGEDEEAKSRAGFLASYSSNERCDEYFLQVDF